MATALFTRDFERSAAKKGLDLEKVKDAGRAEAAVWGQSHLHTGRGIRWLGAGIYETRYGRGWRLLARYFRDRDELVFDFLGAHSEVRRYIRNMR
jgi:hypothetical protein